MSCLWWFAGLLALTVLAECEPLPPHPRLRLTDSGLAALRITLDGDAAAASVLSSLEAHGEQLLHQPPVNCSPAGVEASLLTQARSVLDMTYSLGMLWRLSGNETYARCEGHEDNPKCVPCAKGSTHDCMPASECKRQCQVHYKCEAKHADGGGWNWMCVEQPFKAGKDDGMTKAERLARRKESLRAGDSWEDLHGTKDRPGREILHGPGLSRFGLSRCGRSLCFLRRRFFFGWDFRGWRRRTITHQSKTSCRRIARGTTPRWRSLEFMTTNYALPHGHKPNRLGV